ncbi:MAG: hypothetical protein SV201_06475 [Pseudomonadota bacterium]|nr:hypothetical protein [Pseudomonadota bacterium]
MNRVLVPVIQEDRTGCAIASAAAIAGIDYQTARKVANDLGIHTADPQLWSSIEPLQRLLAHLGIQSDRQEIPFTTWQTLPDCALLAIKWHRENGKPHWHWVVFVRQAGKSLVLDSNPSLKSSIRTDLWRMQPRWSISVRL